MRLDRDAGKVERPRRAELALDHLGTEAAAGGAEEAAIGLEAVGRSGEAERRDLRRHDAVFRRAARVERLGHGPEVLAQPARLGGADADRAPHGLARQSQQLRRTRRAPIEPQVAVL